MALAAACAGEGVEEGDATAESAPTAEAPGLHGQAPVARGTVPSVVTARPVGEAASSSERGTAGATTRSAARIDQFGLQFSPTLLIVDVGAPVTFTNSEGALAHNVHVRSVAGARSIFNDDANSDDELVVTLDAEGGYDVLCDLHPGMNAFVFATADPYATFADADGAFDLGALPPARYELRLWTLDQGFHDPISVTVGPDGAAPEVDLRPSS